eukprot:scaffold94974_cov60-Phaeocystis_antarctica.AAC.14
MCHPLHRHTALAKRLDVGEATFAALVALVGEGEPNCPDAAARERSRVHVGAECEVPDVVSSLIAVKRGAGSTRP